MDAAGYEVGLQKMRIDVLIEDEYLDLFRCTPCEPFPSLLLSETHLRMHTKESTLVFETRNRHIRVHRAFHSPFRHARTLPQHACIYISIRNDHKRQKPGPTRRTRSMPGTPSPVHWKSTTAALRPAASGPADVHVNPCAHLLIYACKCAFVCSSL